MLITKEKNHKVDKRLSR